MESAKPASSTRDVRERHEYEAEFDRIVAFSDGVLAIAITLLVLNIDVPTVAEGELVSALDDLLPHVGAYALSFAVIGRYWVIHHRFFGSLARFDNWLMTRNLLYLALIVLVPFTSELLGDYGNTSAAVIIYAATLGAAALVNWTMIHHAVENDLIKPGELDTAARFGERLALLIPGIFFASIPVALLSPTAAVLMWLAIVFVHGRGGRGTPVR